MLAGRLLVEDRKVPSVDVEAIMHQAGNIARTLTRK
jgi:hypothetical protein